MQKEEKMARQLNEFMLQFLKGTLPHYNPNNLTALIKDLNLK